MQTIEINGNAVQVSLETAKRIEHIASEKKITLSEAIVLCLQKVI